MTLANLVEKDIKKHVAAIHIGNKLTLTQRKASNVLLFNAYENLLLQEIHKIRIKDLAEIIGFDSHNLEPLKDALRGLTTTPLEWNILDEKNREEEWGVSAFLAQAKFRAGFCTYAYSPDLREKLFNPKIYAQLNLSIQRNFSSGHALALYENCLRFRALGATGWINIADFRKLLGIDERAYYHDFRQLNAKIIKPAVKQVNQTSDLFLDVEYRREKRKVVQIKFSIKDNPQMMLFMEGIPAPLPIAENIAIVPPRPDSSEPQNRLLLDRLVSFGLTEKQARSILEAHDQAYIVGNLAVVEQDFEAGKVENLPKYTFSALRDDYRSKETPIEKAKKEAVLAKKSRRLQRQAAKERLDQLQQAFSEDRLNEALNRLTEEKKQALQTEFVGSLQEGGSSITPVIRKYHQKSGFKSKIVESHFRVFARERLLEEPTETEFAVFVQNQGDQVADLRAVLAC